MEPKSILRVAVRNFTKQNRETDEEIPLHLLCSLEKR